MRNTFMVLAASVSLLASCGGQSQQAKDDYRLGMRLIKGAGVTQDQVKGVEILTRAADGGSSEAQLALGFMLMRGEGMTLDAAKGLAYFEQAAENGSVDAQYNAGLAYVRGEATAPDLNKAFRWFEAAALQGDAGSQYNLGVMLLNGEGVEKDPLKAYAWFVLAERGGYGGAGDGIRAAKELLPEDESGNLLKAVSALEKKVHTSPQIKAESEATANTAGDVQEITVPL